MITQSGTERTASGKHHFAVLDGLRGTAALMVVIFHIQGITVMFEGSKVVLHHAPLAVDFFFMLSGFVVGYAYDDRWPGMGVRQFLGLRLVRLHPLLVLGMVLGLASYLMDPFAAGLQNASAGRVALAFGLGLLALPSWPLANRWTDTHGLNGPAWTLFQEYLANIAYAVLLRRLGLGALAAIALVSGLVLAASAITMGTLDVGSYWETAWAAPVRLVFSFTTGLLLFRLHGRLPRWRLGFVPLSLVLTAVFLAPIVPPLGGLSLNGLYEAACVIVLFPLVLILGLHSGQGETAERVSGLAGRLSYPLYITHFPFLYIYMNYVLQAKPTTAAVTLAGIGALLLVLFVAAVVERYWDRPIRAALARRFLAGSAKK